MTRTIHPIALHLEGRACLLTGSGDELEQRARTLIQAGAELLIVTTGANDSVRTLTRESKAKLAEREFVDTDLDGKWLAVQVGRDPNAALEISRAAEARQIFFCAIDLPKFSSFSHMALARAGALTVAISTSGEAPSLGRRLREELMRLFAEANIANFVARIAELRRNTASAERSRALGDAVRGLRFTGKLELPPDD